MSPLATMLTTLADFRDALSRCYAHAHTKDEVEVFRHSLNLARQVKAVLDMAIRQFGLIDFDFRLSHYCEIDAFGLREYLVSWGSANRCPEPFPSLIQHEDTDGLLNICVKLGIPFYAFLHGVRRHRLPPRCGPSRASLHEIARALESSPSTRDSGIKVEIKRKKRHIRRFGLLAAVCSAKRWEAASATPYGAHIKVENRILAPTSKKGKQIVTVENSLHLARRLRTKSEATLKKLYNIIENAEIVP